jgi:CRISPR-associated protein Csm1
VLTLRELAERADGRARWGILLGDVDSFDALLRSAGTAEEHIHLSVMFKEFFAGELSLLGTLPDFWRKVTVAYLGGDEFAVVGSWDALLPLARELQRLFEKFAGENVQGASGFEGKSISMSLAIAPEGSDAPGPVLQSAILQLKQAKATEPGTFSLFGRTLEWKRLGDAEELKSSLVRLVADFGYSPQYIYDLASVYREGSAGRSSRKKAARVDKPWRIYMRLATVIPQSRGKEVNNVRNAVINSLIGKRTNAVKLRPSGRVGLEWARLATGEGN